MTHDVSSIDISATMFDEGASMAINGEPTQSGEVITVALNPAGNLCYTKNVVNNPVPMVLF